MSACQSDAGENVCIPSNKSEKSLMPVSVARNSGRKSIDQQVRWAGHCNKHRSKPALDHFALHLFWPPLALRYELHEAGMLRFGGDPNESVTDANCRFHCIPNTYVVGPRTFSYNRLNRTSANRHCARAPARRSLDVTKPLTRQGEEGFQPETVYIGKMY